MTLPPIKARIRGLFAVFLIALAAVAVMALSHQDFVITQLQAALAAGAGEEAARLEAALAQAQSFSVGIWVVAVAVGLTGLVAAVYFDREVFTALERMSRNMSRFAERDFSSDITGAHRSDEIGAMARALDVFRENGQSLMAHEAENARRIEVQAAERQAVLRDMAESLQSQVSVLISTLRQVSAEMSASAGQMSGSALTAMQRVENVTSTAESTSAHARHVAQTVQGLSDTAADIAQATEASSDVSSRASEEAQQTAEMMARLGRSADEISAVVDIISGIARQTNLLALNATIEAARAGEAGAGFAVVASEVKTLAQETEKATRDITDKVQHIQANTLEAVTAIDNIVGTIQTLRASSEDIARSVAGQQAATREISETADNLAAGSRSVGQDIEAVQHVASETHDAAEAVSRQAESVRAASEGVSAAIDDFIRSLRAA
ncbi:MAG: HAMP domain-containing methyl-accepting chemotaxis protein [Asticcacaulis sp.]